MQELRLVAVSEDGTYLVLATAGRGTRFTLPVDDRLRAAVRGHFSRLGQFEIEVESPLRPKEIQARIRSGETAEEIAESAGIPVERVRWFEGPVLQEREYMAQQAQRVTVRRPGESTPGPPLGETVEERLGRGGVDLEEVEWDSWKCEDGTWRVRLSFFDNGRPHAAEWTFDPRRRHVFPLDEIAARLTAVEWEDDGLSDTVTPLVPRRPAMKVVSNDRDPATRGLPADPREYAAEHGFVPEPRPAFREAVETTPLREAGRPREAASPREALSRPETAQTREAAPSREGARPHAPAEPPGERETAEPTEAAGQDAPRPHEIHELKDARGGPQLGAAQEGHRAVASPEAAGPAGATGERETPQLGEARERDADAEREASQLGEVSSVPEPAPTDEVSEPASAGGEREASEPAETPEPQAGHSHENAAGQEASEPGEAVQAHDTEPLEATHPGESGRPRGTVGERETAEHGETPALEPARSEQPGERDTAQLTDEHGRETVPSREKTDAPEAAREHEREERDRFTETGTGRGDASEAQNTAGDGREQSPDGKDASPGIAEDDKPAREKKTAAQRPGQRQPSRTPAKKKPATRPTMPAAQDKPATGSPAAAANAEPAAQRPARRRKSKAKRASVPSWDEIMFGARRPE